MPLPISDGEHIEGSQPSSSCAKNNDAPCSNASPPPLAAAQLPSSTTLYPDSTRSVATLLKAITPPPLPLAELDVIEVRPGWPGVPKLMLVLV
jgi:hypothetical protein